MDVTSLLNANAAEQQKKGDGSKTTPTRNRTPWDAGGYSLPINTLSSMTTTSLPTTRTSTPPQNSLPNTQEQELELDTPSSPRHKFSDSRSSLSSFTSSLQSASHSRFSSLSTVGSLQQVNSISETLSGTKIQPIEFESSSTSTIDVSRPSTSGDIQPRGSISPTASMEALVLAAEKHSVSQRPSPSRNNSTEDSNMSQTTEKPPSPSNRNEFVPGGRPSSPSDAILIKRSMVPSLRLHTGDHELKAYGDVHLKSNYLSAPLEHHTNSLLNSRGHKRALSAPDFSGVTTTNFVMSNHSNSSSLGPRLDPTPPRSSHPDNDSPISPIASAYPPPDTPPSNAVEVGAVAELKCMFTENCDTGSQLRKAISHIFGRNKMCTRLIPDEVWVHYCRKHYQRSRYRNPKMYANVQCELVERQVRLIEEWSEGNRLNNRPGVVRSWGLAVRKREQKRLDDLSASRKRNASAMDDDVDDAPDGANPPHTAVPKWLRDICGKGYATWQIQEMVLRLFREINENQISFPDIEILPDIIVNDDEPKSPKGYTKRVSGVRSHARSQSLGVGMKQPYQSPDRRQSQPAIWPQDNSAHSGSVYSGGSAHSGSSYAGSPIQKRLRQSSEANLGLYRSHLTERPQMYNIAEYTVDNERYAQAPLPAPSPQRMGSHTISQLESNQFTTGRRPLHQRSHSDMGSFSPNRNRYTPNQSSSYSPEVPGQFGRSPFHEQPQAVAHGYSPHQQPRWEPIPQAQQMHHTYPQRPMGQSHPGMTVSSHHRVHSTPIVPAGYGTPPHQQFGNLSPYNGALPSVPHVTESQQVRDFYNNQRR